MPNPIRVTLKCLKAGCPRIKKVSFDDTMPEGTVEIHSYCPWHSESGWKDSPEHCFDKDGNEL